MCVASCILSSLFCMAEKCHGVHIGVYRIYLYDFVQFGFGMLQIIFGSLAHLLIIVFYHHPRIFFREHSSTLYTIQQCLNGSQCNCWIDFLPRDISFISLVIITPVIRSISLRLWLIVWDSDIGGVKVNLYFTYIQWIWHFKLDDTPPTSSYHLIPHFTYQPSYV